MLGLQIYDLIFNLQPFASLLEPLGEVILRVEVVHDEADPAGDEDQDDGDDLSDDGDGFLENVDDREDGKDDTDDVNEGSHGFGLLSVKRSLVQKYEKVAEMQELFASIASRRRCRGCQGGPACLHGGRRRRRGRW